MLEAIILTVITAATPLLLASIGELVVERSGVLNLGVEGMMVMGAVAGFGVTLLSGSPFVGVIGGMLAGAATSLIFAFATQTLVANQVASGLALTLFGLGVSGLVGESFVGTPGIKLPRLDIPGLSDLPFVGRILFGQDALVYLAFALVGAVTYVLFRTRTGLVLRAVGDSHSSAHALGYGVIGVRYLAIFFGGACAGLGGAYLSVAYTPLWVENMTAGRGWIALALVVFASWIPYRLVIGALLFGGVTVLQLHAQAIGIAGRVSSYLRSVLEGAPEALASAVISTAAFFTASQFLSALPYLTTVLVLVLISRNRTLLRVNTPACLGQPFVPER
jgi:simple sugar transport system permease protein